MVDLFRVHPFDPQHRFSSSTLVSPIVLALLRALFSTYIFTTLIYTLVYSAVAHDNREIARHWAYFTNITAWALAFYFLFAFVHGLVYCLTGRPLLQRWPTFFQAAHSMLYSTIVVFPFLVTILYWAILAPTGSPFESVYSTWRNVSVHILNSVFALFEIIVPATERMPWIHLPFLVFFIGGYIASVYVTYAVQGFYTYEVLDPKGGAGKVAGYAIGATAGMAVIFVIVWLVIWGRQTLFEKKLRMEVKGAASEETVAEEKGRLRETPVPKEEA